MHGVCWAPGYSVEHADILAALAMLRAEQREALILVEAIRFSFGEAAAGSGAWSKARGPTSPVILRDSKERGLTRRAFRSGFSRPPSLMRGRNLARLRSFCRCFDRAGSRVKLLPPCGERRKTRPIAATSGKANAGPMPTFVASAVIRGTPLTTGAGATCDDSILRALGR
jgi:hypothetical protein